jgi:gluconokinase
MHIEGLRSPYDQVGGLVFFGRMLDKARLHAAGKLPADYNRGFGLDSRVCTFLHLDYERIVEKALAEPDEARMLEWCYEQARRPTDEEILIFNAFMTKRGWRDEQSEDIRMRKIALGLEDRDDIQTCFDIHDADEGRK